MEAFSFCMEIIKREGEKFNVGINTSTASQITAATAEIVNYDVAHNRCSYLYRCGAINLSFAKDCFNKFFSEYKSIAFLLTKWISSPNVTLCCLSKGPALDYIAFLLSYQECGMFPLIIFKNIKVISKYGAWRNTVNLMHQIITEGYLKDLSTPESVGNIEVIQGDPFVDFTQKVKDPIFDSDVVIMMKKLNLQADGYNQDKIIIAVQEFLAALKSDAILFCIDTKPSIALITKEISAFEGTYLFQPTFMNTMINLDHTDLYKVIYGCTPVLSARGTFFVWQKKSPVLSQYQSASNLNSVIDGVSESITQLLKINNDSGYCDEVFKSNCNSQTLVSDILHCSTPINFIQEHSNDFTSNESLKFDATNSESSDQLSDKSINLASKISKNFPSSDSSQNEFLINEHGDENVLTKESSTHSTSVNKAVQTELENTFKSTESVKIAALTEKISNLTASLKNLMQMNEVKDDSLYNGCLKHRENTCKSSVTKDCISSHCASDTCLTKSYDECSENNICNFSQGRNLENYCSNHIHKQGCLPCSQHNSNTTLNDLGAAINCNSSCNTVRPSTEQKSVPKLVIPLNNLSGDVIAKIISLISGAN